MKISHKKAHNTQKTICLVLLMIGFVMTANAQQRGLKIYISADMEGVVGVVSNEQLGPQGFEYGRFREFMTQEVNAAIAGAVAAGATEIVVLLGFADSLVGSFPVIDLGSAPKRHSASPTSPITAAKTAR